MERIKIINFYNLIKRRDFSKKAQENFNPFKFNPLKEKQMEKSRFSGVEGSNQTKKSLISKIYDRSIDLYRKTRDYGSDIFHQIPIQYEQFVHDFIKAVPFRKLSREAEILRFRISDDLSEMDPEDVLVKHYFQILRLYLHTHDILSDYNSRYLNNLIPQKAIEEKIAPAIVNYLLDLKTLRKK